MAVITRWFRFVGATPYGTGGQLGMSAAQSAEFVQFGEVVDGNGNPLDIRVSAVFDTSVSPIDEFDGLMSRQGFEPSTDPNP